MVDQHSPRMFPDPWHDPDFSADQAAWGKSEVGSTVRGSGLHQRARQQSRYHFRIWVISLVLLILGAGLLLDPMVGPLVLGSLMAFGLTLALIVGTMALGMMGHGLFAAGDLVIAWLRQGRRWPEQ